MLRVIAALNDEQPIELAATFMGAHEVPPEFRGRQQDYVALVIDRMIPAAAGLAEWCDVFCDPRILHAGGIGLRSSRPASAPA
jgi:imidazolonepropionase